MDVIFRVSILEVWGPLVLKTRKRSVSLIVSIILVVIVSAASALLLYSWLGGAASTAGALTGQASRGLCHARIVEAFANTSGIFAVIVPSSCRLTSAYLDPGGEAVELVPVMNKSGLLRLVPARQVEPGRHALSVQVDGANSLYQLLIRSGLPEFRVFRNLTVDSTWTATHPSTPYNVTLSLSARGRGNYRLTVRVSPNPGYVITYVGGEIYNSTLDPPVYVGPYYKTSWSGRASYPDYVEWYWQPLIASEQPYLVVISVAWERS